MAYSEASNKNIIHILPAERIIDPRGIGCLFYEVMQSNKDKVAQILATTGEKDTFGQLLQRSIRVAIAMKQYIVPGDFVSVCTLNHLDSGTPYIASLFVGAKMAAVDPSLSVEDTVLLLKQAPPKLIFVSPPAVEMIEKVIATIRSDTKIVIFGDTVKHIPFADFLQPSHEEATFKPRTVSSLDEIALLFFTSGTSGLPKAVCYNHHAMMPSIPVPPEEGVDSFCFDLTFSVASPYWTVFISFLNGSILSGTARLVDPRHDFTKLWEIFSHKVTLAFLNTTQILAMLSQGRPKTVDLSSTKDILIGGGKLTREQMLKTKEMFHDTRVYAIYGQTEVLTTITAFDMRLHKHHELMKKKPTSCGLGVGGVSYKIVDPETEEILGLNQKGELRVKSDRVLTCYHNLDSSDVFDSDGYLKTGDLAYYDEDLCFYIVDRVKEMFKFQSWHVVPAVIEQVILTHPAVHEVVVVGVPHEIDGDHPMAVLTLKDDHKGTAPEEIVKYVDERVHDRQRLRAGVKIVNSLPMTPTDKVNRRKVKEMIKQGKI